MGTSRQRVLEYIRIYRTVTADEISRIFNMTPANARHHLKILIEDNLIAKVGRRAVDGRGRPAIVYAPTDGRDEHNYQVLVSALLTQFKEDSDEALFLINLDNVASKIAAQTGQNAPAARSLTARLYQAVQVLNKLHYNARWEAHSSGPHVILTNCPYKDIIDDHPELCILDSRLIDRLVNAQAEQIAKLAKDRQGRSYCEFRVAERRQPALDQQKR